METEGLVVTSSAIKGLALQNTSGPVCAVCVHIKLYMETNDQFHVPVALPQGKNPLLCCMLSFG